MKKLLLLPLLLCAVLARAQYVNIPDTGFATFLRSYYPAAMSGSMLDTTSPAILSVTTFKSLSPYIRNLDGIQYFDNLEILTCECSELDTVPALPASLRYAYFADCNFTTLPELPPNLIELEALTCQLTELPVLPASLRILDVRENPHLFCFPVSLTDTFISLYARYGTGITCLPKMPVILGSGDGSDLLPVCSVLSGCPVDYNISGMLHEDTSASCSLDSLHPGTGIAGLKVKKLNSGVLTQQRYSGKGGYYSFDAAIGDSISIVIDTPEIPVSISCPATGVRIAKLTATDSVFEHLDFGLECAGVDLGVRSIVGRFRTNQTRPLHIEAGDLSRCFNLLCASGTSGTVTTTISGPVSYVRPASGALTPGTVSGGTLTYAIADFGTVDPLSAFNIIVKTDSLAVPGTNICINVIVSSSIPDARPANDTLSFCDRVVYSYDPNYKTAYPHQLIGPDEWITYTINFQNTGTDTAYRILLRDTLDNNLDPASFRFLASSHNTDISLDGNAVLFNFSAINLPDSLHDEPNSHGWVQYKVKTLPSFPLTSIIYNKAFIYFDSNDPVVTNTTRHAQFALSVNDPIRNRLRVYPNPTERTLVIETGEAGMFRIYTIVGTQVSEIKLHAGVNTIELQKTLSSGLYIYHFEGLSGQTFQGKFEKR